MPTPFNLENKHILVTGASITSDIGFATCNLLANLGARLTLVSRNFDNLEKTRNAITNSETHFSAPYDLNDIDNIPKWLKKITKENAPFDGMAHLASYMGYSPLKAITPTQIHQYFNLNFSASVMLAKGFSARGVSNSNSSIVYVGSIAGLKGQKARSLYSASKATLVSLSQSLSMELISKKIRVNCVAPAVIIGNRSQEQFDLLPEQQRKDLDEAHPTGYGTPEDVANAIAYLMTDSAKWITGTTLPLDGGFMAQ